MNTRVLSALLSGLILLSCGCSRDAQEKKAKPTFMFWNFRKEIVSADYRVPGMKTKAAGDYLQKRISALPGYVDSTYDLSTGILTVRYRSTVLRKMNIEQLIAHVGFAVNNRPAHKDAQLPDGVEAE